MSVSVQFVVPTSQLHGGIRVPLELASWLADCGWLSRVVGPGPRPDWHETTAPWISIDLEGGQPVPRADITIATFHTTVGPAVASGSRHLFHLCQGYEGLFGEYDDIRDRIDEAYRHPVPKLLVSRHLEMVLDEHYAGVECEFIGEAVDPRIFFPLGFRQAASPLRVGLVGTFSATVKGIRNGLEGLRMLRDRGLEIEVHRASVEPLQGEEEALGVTDRFHHLLPTARMPEFYAAIDVLLFPSSDQEGFGLPVLEAMSCGVPVAHSDIPSLVVFPDGASLRFPAGDATAIADTVAKLADPEVRRSLRTEALLAVEDYRPQTVLSRLEEVFARRGCPLPDGSQNIR
jgi:glycosyltransferase involved in cell wall biosynthesis